MGAPTGVAVPIEPKGVFPAIDQTGETLTGLTQYFSRAGDTYNYASVEENRVEVEQEINRLCRKGFVTIYKTWDDLRSQMGEVVVSRMASQRNSG